MYESFIRFKAGNGHNVRFWKDRWLRESTLKEDFTDIFNLSLNQDATLVDAWNEDLGTWNLSIRRGIFDWEMQAWIGLTEKLEDLPVGPRRR